MNINLTLVVQMIVFAILIWFTMKFAWPIILDAMDEREKKIAAGLAAAEKGEKALAEAREKSEAIIREARIRGKTMTPEKSDSRPFWLTVLAFTFAISLYAALSTYARSTVADIILQRSIWGGMLIVYSGTALFCIWLFIHVARSGSLPFNISAYVARTRFDRPFSGAWRDWLSLS